MARVQTPTEGDVGQGAQPSLGQLFSEMTSDLSELFRKEVELAKVEIKEQVTRSGKAGGMFGGAAVAGGMTLLLLSFAAAWAFSVAIPIWAGFLIMGALYATVAGVLFLAGRSRMRRVDPVPHETIETIQEDVQWARTLKS